jgi:hypothetical protein
VSGRSLARIGRAGESERLLCQVVDASAVRQVSGYHAHAASQGTPKLAGPIGAPAGELPNLFQRGSLRLAQ